MKLSKEQVDVLSDKEVLLSISGGVDSSVLLHLLVKEKIRPTLLHINYHFRDKDSDLDEKHVRNLAETHQLELIVKHFDPNTLTKNLQNEARNFRRNEFQNWQAKSKKHIVLLAHHSDDQIETFFIQLLRGASTTGLAGMKEEDKQTFRPLLKFSKEDILKFAQSSKISWREDRSNSQDYYLRNLFRNKLLPFLYQDHPNLKKEVLYFQEILQNSIQNEIDFTSMIINQHISTSFWKSLAIHDKCRFLKEINQKTQFWKNIDDLILHSLGKEFRTKNCTFFVNRDGISWFFSAHKTPNYAFSEQEISDQSIFIPKEIWSNIEHRTARKSDFLVFNDQKQNLVHFLKNKRIAAQERKLVEVLFYKNQLIYYPEIFEEKFVLFKESEQIRIYYKKM